MDISTIDGKENSKFPFLDECTSYHSSKFTDNSGSITLKYQFNNVEKLKIRQIRSEPVETRSMYWRIMVTTKLVHRSPTKPNENCIEGNTDNLMRYLSIYIQCDPINESKFWHCYAKCKVTLLNKDASKNITKEFRNNFTKKENDFGYSEFILLNKLLDNTAGFLGAPDGNCNDTIAMIAEVITEYPYGVDWDSRGNTDHVGLLNLGATCYMNSLLQTFFFTNQLRLATYNTPTYMDDNDNSIMYALQHIFYQLQFSLSAVDTTKLTQAFGWTQADSFQQHDVQEFCRILLESMENSMKGTAAENIIAKLLEGKQMSFIKCVNVDYQSERIESVYDIQLKVKGLRNVYESFDDYIKIEKLEGENKYAADGYGYQDADKGVIFTHFPPVLHLHLMRFTFDMQQLDFIKIRDRYEFPEELDLDRYLSNEYVSPDDPAIYSLAAVLVHIGGTNSGHYVVYINPNCSGDWLKFDDELVVKVNKNEAIEDNFGGTGVGVFKPGTTAYMLAYVRNSAKDHVFKHINGDDIPTELTNRILHDIEKEKYAQYKSEHEKEVVNVNIYLEDNLYVTQSKGLLENITSYGYHFEFFQHYTIREILGVVCSKLKVNQDYCRVWVFPEDINNNTLCLPKFLSQEYYSTTLKDLICYTKKLSLFLDFIDPSISSTTSDVVVTDDEYPPRDDQTALLFVKYYDPILPQLSYVGHIYVDVNKRWRDYVDYLMEKSGIKYNPINGISDNNITLYIEDGKEFPHKILNMDNCIGQIVSKDCSCIVCIQENISIPPTTSITDFSQFVFQKNTDFTVKFIDKNLPGVTERYFIASCSPNAKYIDLMKVVASHVIYPTDQIQLYYSSQKNIDLNKLDIFNENNPLTVFDIAKKAKFLLLNTSSNTERTCTIFYECLNIKVNELVNNVRFDLKFVPGITLDADKNCSKFLNCELVGKYSSPLYLPLLLPRSSTVEDLIVAANNYLKSIDYPLKNSVRIFEVITSKIVCILSDDIAVSRITPSIEKTLVVEETPIGQMLPLTCFDRLINCCFCKNKNFRQFIGIPFLIKISMGMSYDDVYQLILYKLKCYSQEFIDGCSFFIVRTQELESFPAIDNSNEMSLNFPFERLFGTPRENDSDDLSDNEVNHFFIPNIVIGINVSSSGSSPLFCYSSRNNPALKIAK